MRRLLVPALLVAGAAWAEGGGRELERRVAALEARLAEVTAAPSPLAFDHGLVLRAGPALLRLGGLLQVRYTGWATPGAAGSASFDLHHGAVALSGEGGRFLAARLMVDFGNAYFAGAPFAVGGGILRDAWVEVRPRPWLRLRGGQITIPFGRQRLLDDRAIAEVERNLATLAFAVDRDLGLQVEAAPWGQRLLLQLSVSDGVNAGDPGARNDNLDVRLVARLVGAPLGPLPAVEGEVAAGEGFRFSVGAAGLYDLVPTDDPVVRDHDRNGRVDNVEVLAANAEVAVAWRRLSLQGEYFFRRQRYGAAAATAERSYHGFSAQGQVVLWRRFLLVAAHLAYAEPHTLGTQLASQASPPLFLPTVGANAVVIDGAVPLTAWSAGGTLVGLWGSHDLKLQLGYELRRHRLAAGGLDGHLLQIQASLAL